MSVQATIVLDAGIILHDITVKSYPPLEVGYFHSLDAGYDVVVYADGEMLEKLKLGPGDIEVNHVVAIGGGPEVTISKSLPGELLRRSQLYGRHVDVDRNKLDCTLRFNAGHFCSSMVMPRVFKEHGGGPAIPAFGPIAHSIMVQYVLADNDELQLKGRGIDWTSTGKAGRRLDVELIAENSTALKFYRDCVILPKGRRAVVPNQGHPPPTADP